MGEANATEWAQGDARRLQSSLVDAMTQRSFYPKAPAEVLYRETHISHVFLVGDLVYKVKKALRGSPVDYSTPDKRRHFLLEELRLNRRLAPSVYLAVIAIALGERGWQLSAEGAAAEYALVMRRLPERRMLSFLLDTQQATPKMMRELAEVIAAFHGAAERSATAAPRRHLSAVEDQWSANIRELGDFTVKLIDNDLYSTVKDFGDEFLKSNAGLIIARAEQGWIRDLHGDLHCEHICFAPEGIQIFDCVEFDDRLRCCDVASEVALLVADLDVRGGSELARVFLQRYMELSQDPELPTLLPFYRCHGALVRGKVNALRASGREAEAARYFRYAGLVTWEPLRPFVVLLCGLTGSGKSTVARELSRRFNLPVLSSEEIRKHFAAKSGRQLVPFLPAVDAALPEKTYTKMARETEKQILAGNGAILDATFAQRGYREKIQRVAAKHGVPLFLIHCAAPEQVIKTRLAQSAQSSDTPQDRWNSYVEQKAACQPIRELPSGDCLNLNTEPPVDEVIAVCERFLRSRLAQRQDRLGA
jgi:aminoglycoside phosphotransferase family enzyme/predicted kinase